VLAGKRREESEKKSKLYMCWPGREEKKQIVRVLAGKRREERERA
jgi:hypothetical protein